MANTPAARAARKYVSDGDASELSVEQLERLDKRELDELARDRDIRGRSKMDKQELADAVAEAEAG